MVDAPQSPYCVLNYLEIWIRRPCIDIIDLHGIFSRTGC
jgi:hypothetical protein